ncbi:MAG: CbtA family protein [Thermoleophilia bacterium]
MVRSLLIQGMLVGVLAGLLAFGVASVIGEPQVQAAIDFEARQTPPSASAADTELVSRATQRTGGLLAGTVAMGVALGGLFALVFAWAYGRASRRSARVTSAALALAAFVTVTVVPFTKYPANPPAVSNPDTLDRRTVLFLAMIAISIAALVAATRIRRQLLTRLGDWNATLAAAIAFVALVAAAQLIMPAVHEMPAGFPADVLYRFRLASVGVSATLWAVLGIGFGITAERLVARTATTATPAKA